MRQRSDFRQAKSRMTGVTLAAVAVLTAQPLGASAEEKGEAMSTGSASAIVEQGVLAGSVNDGIAVFRGIPFAAPPIGKLRWQPPKAPAAWSGVRDASAFGHDCMQTPFPGDEAPLRTSPDEDCLYINVWKPAAAQAKKLPVLVWFYGGAFVGGGTSPAIYDGSAFARRDIVFVSFNYRLARFGFFSHPALTAEQGPVGNFAVSDQVAALKWVQRNIAAFGGDPAKVTIIGESAGGTSVINMLTVPSARGLFRGAIAMSGGGRSLLRTASLKQGEEVGVNFARREGIEGIGAEALAALRALPAATIRGSNIFGDRLGTPMTYVGGYVADGKIMPRPSDASMAAGDMARVPVMIGWTSADAGLTMAQDKEQLFASVGDAATRLRTAYDPGGDRAFEDLRNEITRDQYMAEPARFVARHARDLGNEAYVYRFGYVAEAMRPKWSAGAPHATDIPFFFDTVDTRYKEQTTPQDRAAARLTNDYVVNFVKTGDPNGRGLPRWKPYRKGGEAIMDFGISGTATSIANPSTAKLDIIESTATIPQD